jgi:hypothetical protein
MVITLQGYFIQRIIFIQVESNHIFKLNPSSCVNARVLVYKLIGVEPVASPKQRANAVVVYPRLIGYNLCHVLIR